MSRVSSSRPYLIVFGGLALLGVWLQSPVTTRPASTSLEPQQAKVSIAPAPRRDAVFATTASPAMPVVATNAAHSVVSSPVNPAPAPFAFLGRFVEDGEAVVLLYRAGQTLKVRGTGSVAKDYEVDALLDNLVVLRHVPSGTQQLIELASRNDQPLSGSPEDFPRD